MKITKHILVITTVCLISTPVAHAQSTGLGGGSSTGSTGTSGSTTSHSAGSSPTDNLGNNPQSRGSLRSNQGNSQTTGSTMDRTNSAAKNKGSLTGSRHPDNGAAVTQPEASGNPSTTLPDNMDRDTIPGR